jgi:hypothetical protein
MKESPVSTRNEIIVDLRPISANGVFDLEKLPLRAPFRGPVIGLGFEMLQATWSKACASLPDTEWSVFALSKHKLVRKQEEIRICQALFAAVTPTVIEYSYSYAGRSRVKLAVSRGACKLLADEMRNLLGPDFLSMQRQLQTFGTAWGAIGEVKRAEVQESELDIKLDRLNALEAALKTA